MPHSGRWLTPSSLRWKKKMPDSRIVIVTGAAGALGAAVVDEFAKRGDRIVQIDIVKPKNGHAYFNVNLEDAASCTKLASDVNSQFGRIDVLANIAGGFTMGEAVHETKDDTWRGMFDLNARSVLNMARAVVPQMLAKRRGKIVSIAARAGLRGVAKMGAYTASKSVVIRLTETMADELKESGINVNCVLPSIIDTARNRADMPNADFSRWVKPNDVAKVIAFLASDDAAAIHGAAIPVEGLS
jgi:NAD(P)-dependent dehydrogenase (short-subunit alcohol dehydrogenase family)